MKMQCCAAWSLGVSDISESSLEVLQFKITAYSLWRGIFSLFIQHINIVLYITGLMSLSWAGQKDALSSTRQRSTNGYLFFLFFSSFLFFKSSIKCFRKQSILSAKVACLTPLLQWPTYRKYSYWKGLFPRSSISNKNISKIRWKVFKGSLSKDNQKNKRREKGHGDESRWSQEAWCSAYFYEWPFSGFIINSFVSYLFVIICLGVRGMFVPASPWKPKFYVHIKGTVATAQAAAYLLSCCPCTWPKGTLPSTRQPTSTYLVSVLLWLWAFLELGLLVVLNCDEFFKEQ